jgi:hypothetical protein
VGAKVGSASVDQSGDKCLRWEKVYFQLSVKQRKGLTERGKSERMKERIIIGLCCESRRSFADRISGAISRCLPIDFKFLIDFVSFLQAC